MIVAKCYAFASLGGGQNIPTVQTGICTVRPKIHWVDVKFTMRADKVVIIRTKRQKVAKAIYLQNLGRTRHPDGREGETEWAKYQ